MKTKKIIVIGSVLLCALLITGLVLHFTRTTGTAANTPTLTVSKETAGAGEEVTVSVDLSDNPGLMVLLLQVSYDRTRLTLTGAEGVGLTGWDVSGDRLLWLGNADSTYNGTILNLNFHVPDSAEPGEAQVTLTCSRGDAGNHDEQWYVPVILAGSVTVTGDAAPAETEPAPVSTETEDTALPFTDVYEGSYYYTPVVWAYENNITYGRAADTFDPDGTCTRGEIVTFLWRVVGCPEPDNENPFADLSETDYCYTPVLWAVENGITYGTGEDSFSPMQTCSTAEIVTFVYRALGIGPDGWYEEAGDWANGAGLMNDTGLLVDPNEACPRSAVVTILYRWSLSR